MTSTLECATTPLLPLVGHDLLAPTADGCPAGYLNFDCAASTPALQPVVDEVLALLPAYSSVHRGAGYASVVTTERYERARQDIAAFVGARDEDVCIVARNTTDAIAILAGAVPADLDVVCLDIEHHANLLPWSRSRGGRGQRVVIGAEADWESTAAALERHLRAGTTGLLAVTGASNVTGELLPVERLARLAHRHGARLFVDGAQLVPHRRVSLSETGADYIAFSGHKIYAPFGAGVLVGRRDWLDAAPPYLQGGGAVSDVRVDCVTWQPSPARHEAGTPNVIGLVALAAACRVIAALPAGVLEEHETHLRDRLVDKLSDLSGLTILRCWNELETTAVVTFTMSGWDPAALAGWLSTERGIGVRDGRFCAHPLLERLGAPGGAVRASAGLGTTSRDVDVLVAALASLPRP